MSKALLKFPQAPAIRTRDARVRPWLSRDAEALSLRETTARACLYGSVIAGLWVVAVVAFQLSSGTPP